MKLHSTYGLTGEIIFQDNHWIIGRITEGAFGNVISGDLKPNEILDACQVRGVVHTNGRLAEYFAPRECAFLAISKNPFIYMLKPSTLADIETAAAKAQMGDPIARFWDICKSVGLKKLDARTVFNTAHIKDGKLVYAHSQLNPSTAIKFDINRNTFSVGYPEGNQGEATGVCFSNHFEMIYVPIDNLDKAFACVKRVLERANLPGRVASDYIVLPVIWDEPQACIRVRQLDNMTSKELIAYFGGGKSKGNKMETLSSCLEYWTKYVPFMEVDDVHYVQLNTQAPETPIDIQPIDWVLARASHFQVIHSDQPAAEAVDMFVKICDKPCDDFAAALYTLFEAQKQPVNVVGIHGDRINSLFQEIKNRVNAASKA
jgi:hypothetical protein